MGSGESEGRFVGIGDGDGDGSILKVTELAPPEGRENFLGGGTFKKHSGQTNVLRIQHSYHLLLPFSFLHSNPLVLRYHTHIIICVRPY